MICLGYPIEVPFLGKDGKLFTDRTRLRDEFSFASKNGFERIRLSYSDSPRPDMSPKEIGVAEVKQLLKENDVLVENVASTGNKIHTNPEVRKKEAKLLRDTVDFCRLFDVKVIATHLGSPEGSWYIYGNPGLFGNPSYARGWDSKSPQASKVDYAIGLYGEVLTPIAEHAEKQDVKIALENNFRADGNIAHSPFMWDRMFKALPSKTIGLRIDPSHFICLMIGPVESILRRYGDKIYAVDGKDCEIIPEMLQAQGIYGNLWWRYRIPGYGNLDWPKIISALMDIGYKGAIVLENEDPIMEGKPGYLQAARYLRPLLYKQ